MEIITGHGCPVPTPHAGIGHTQSHQSRCQTRGLGASHLRRGQRHSSLFFLSRFARISPQRGASRGPDPAACLNLQGRNPQILPSWRRPPPFLLQLLPGACFCYLPNANFPSSASLAGKERIGAHLPPAFRLLPIAPSSLSITFKIAAARSQVFPASSFVFNFFAKLLALSRLIIVTRDRHLSTSPFLPPFKHPSHRNTHGQ